MTAQSPLFPDIVPEPDETVWDVFDGDDHWVDQVVGRRAAFDRAQALADEYQGNVWIREAVHNAKESEIVRPFGLPW